MSNRNSLKLIETLYKEFSPQHFQLPQIVQPQFSQITSLRQKGKSESVREYSIGFWDLMILFVFLWADQNLGQEFCYLNNYGYPYEWKVVNEDNRNLDYYMTISGRGIIIHHSIISNLR